MSGRGNYDKAAYLKTGIPLETYKLNDGRRQSAIPETNKPAYPKYP